MNILCQRDTRWKDVALGTKGTIGDYGCLITCLAMASDLSPIEVNDRLKSVGGYQDGNLVIWTKIQAAIPWMQFEWRGTPYDNDRVKGAIDKNGFCLVEVDGSRIGGTKHWVLYIGGGQMYDPWTGVQKATSYYPAVGYSIINKVDIPTPPESPEVVQLKVDLSEQRKQVSNLQAQVNGLLLDIGGWENKYNECITQLNEAKTSSDGFRKQYNNFISKLAVKLETRQEEVEVLAAIDTAITYEDKATELDRTIALERRNHAEAIDVLEKRIAWFENELLSVKKELQSVKDTQPKSIVVTTPYGVIIDIVKKLLGR